jgi:pimeloyl-ACP methyl ester carboxylesterase
VSGATAYGGVTLPEGVRARTVDNRNGLDVHLLEAGFGSPRRPLALLLHGFPEIAWSWRHALPALAAAGLHVVAPDQRGFGRTRGWTAHYDQDLAPYRMLNLVRDVLGLVTALGHERVALLVGHDLGARVAAAAALARPDVFRSLALMSAPFAGAPDFPDPDAASARDVHAALAARPRPRKHYQWYYSTREADADMHQCAQGVHDFLRAYFHMKSADWPQNAPHPLASWSAEELAKLPDYYVMDRDRDMAATVAPHMPSADAVAACRWLPEADLRVYSAEYERTGFQGGLQWYRCGTSGDDTRELRLFAGRTVDVPACFVAGASDWGIHQKPGALEAMQSRACSRFLGCHLVGGAGHWVQQEQPEAVHTLLLEFLTQASAA